MRTGVSGQTAFTLAIPERHAVVMSIINLNVTIVAVNRVRAITFRFVSCAAGGSWRPRRSSSRMLAAR
jgi:hypothetical protein